MSVHAPILAVLLVSLPSMLFSQEFVLELTTSKDNTLYLSTGNDTLSNGAGDHFFAGMAGNGTIQRSVMHFELPDTIPETATIQAVVLELNRSRQAANANGNEIIIHRLLADWGEGSSDAPMGEGGGTAATAEDATWYHTFYSDEFWDQPGGDFEADPSAIWTSDNGTPTWGSTPGMIADIEAWLENPETNFGWLLKMDDEGGAQTSNRFDSKDNPVAANRPKLTITYTNNLDSQTIYSIHLDGDQAGTASTGSGYGIGTFSLDSSKLTVSGRFQGLSGNTTVAHVHIGNPGIAGPIIFPLTLMPAGDTAGTFFGCDTLSQAQRAAVLTDGLYVNIHTTAVPAGEIRGQISLEDCADPFEAIAPVIPPFQYRAISIVSSGTIDSLSRVIYSFETNLELEPGFEMEATSSMEARQEGCDN